MIELVMLCLVSAAFAEPETLPATPESGSVATSSEAEPADPRADGSFGSVLEKAKEKYFQGESSEARELLQGLQLRLYAGEEADWSSVVEALTYLGEIYYVQGEQDQAQMAFQYLLERDPNTPISPYHHAIEVVNLFELVRTTVVASRLADVDNVPPPTVERSPAPLWTFVPFGVPQFMQGRTGLGVFYGGLQLGFGAASVALYPHLAKVNRESLEHPLGWGPEEVTEKVQERRYLFQWPATFGFYTMWGVSMIDAARWHQRHPKVLGVGLQPRPFTPDPMIASPGTSPPILVIHGQL